MRIARGFALALGLALFCGAGAALASTQPASVPMPASPTGPQRVITLDELGYADGIGFSDLSGRLDLYFPVPAGPWVRSLRLRLPYSSTAAFDSRRSLQVLAAGRVVFVSPLTKDATSQIIDVPVPPEAVRDGSVVVTLLYSGALSDNRCLDNRVVGDSVTFAPDGGLVLGLDDSVPLTVAAALALIPRDVTIQLPAAPDERQAAAALTIVAANSRAEIALGPVPASGANVRGLIAIGGPMDPALRVVRGTGLPEIIIGGPDPAGVARAIFSPFAPILADADIAQIATVRPAANRLTLADLNADTRILDVPETGIWNIGLPLSRLPAGQTISGLDIGVALPPDASAANAFVSVRLNGTLLATAPADPKGPTWLHIDDVPDGLVSARNSIEVRVTRQHRQDCGDVPLRYPTQLLGASAVRFGGAPAVSDFFQLGPDFHSGVTVVVPNAAALPLAAKAVGGLAGQDALITVSYGRIPDTGPVILVSRTPPPGSHPWLDFAGNNMKLVDQAGRVRLTMSQLQTLTTAQLLNVSGRPVLWLRPGDRAPVPAALWLDRGDVAFIGASGVVLAVATGRDSLYRVTGGGDSAGGFFSQTWVWIALIAFAALLIALFVVLRNRRSPPPPEEE